MTDSIARGWRLLAWFLLAAVSAPLALTVAFSSDPTARWSVALFAFGIWPAGVFCFYRAGLWLARRTVVGRLIAKGIDGFVG